MSRPAVAHHDRSKQVDPPARGRVAEHPRPGLAALAAVGVVVRTDPDLVDRKPGEKLPVHGVENPARHPSTGEVGLIRHDDQHKAGRAEGVERLNDTGQDLELVEGAWRRRNAVAKDHAVDDAVAVQELPPRRRAGLLGAASAMGATDSQRLGRWSKSGWQTRQCHTTA